MSPKRTPTSNTPDEAMRRTLTVTFSVDARSDEHLQSDEAIRGEIQSWLESLDATVHTVELAEPTREPGTGG